MRRLSDQLLRAVALVVTDRRWAAPLSAMALGFGLFIGVAIGPSAAGTLATGAQQIVEVPGPRTDMSENDAGEGDDGGDAAGASLGGGDGSVAETVSPESPLPSPLPLASAGEPAPPVREPEPAKTPPLADEPEAQETTELKGTVVHANTAAGSYALAIDGGELVPVHAPKLPPAGAKMTIAALQLANGTFVEAEQPKRFGKADRASIRGVVTFVDADPAAPAYTVSGRGASPLVRVTPDPGGAVPPLPVLGSRVVVDVALEPDAVLLQQQIEIEEGEPSAYLDLAGIYGGTAPETGQLLLSADDTRASEADLALTVPPAIETLELTKGDSLVATATVGADGSLELTGLASDEHRKGADEASSAQGDLKR